MAITAPGLTLAIEPLFGAIKPVLGTIQKIGATDFSAAAPGADIKPGTTVKYPISSIEQASEYNASTNNYTTGGSTSWASLTATHFLKGYDLCGEDIDKGVNASRIRQLFTLRAGGAIGRAVQSATSTALDGATASTGVTLPAAPTLAQYIALAADKAWLDRASSCLVLNGAELALVRGVCAAAHLAGSDDEIARYLGFGSLALLPGMTARAVIVPESSVGFLARVPAIAAKYVQAGVQSDPDTGLSVGIVVADDQANNRQIANADLWFGAAVLSANAAASTAGVVKVGTSE